MHVSKFKPCTFNTFIRKGVNYQETFLIKFILFLLMPCSFIINSSSLNDTWMSNKISSYLFANRNRAKINKFVITKFVLQISDLCNEWIPDSRCLVKSPIPTYLFTWVPCGYRYVNVSYTTPGHLSLVTRQTITVSCAGRNQKVVARPQRSLGKSSLLRSYFSHDNWHYRIRVPLL